MQQIEYSGYTEEQAGLFMRLLGLSEAETELINAADRKGDKKGTGFRSGRYTKKNRLKAKKKRSKPKRKR